MSALSEKLRPITTLLRKRRGMIAPDKTVVFFPTAGCPKENGRWHVPMHGWVYRPMELSLLRRAGMRVAKRLFRLKGTDPGMAVFWKRMGAFLADNERWERVRVSAGGEVFKMKRSHSNGHFEGAMELSAEPGWLVYRAALPAGDERMFAGRSLLLPAEGVSVISDIDDTIKLTGVGCRREMMANTFVRDFACVPEMAALYRRWEQQRGAAFHYVSASPWHLFPLLAEFLAGQNFPAGTWHMRYFRLMGTDLVRTLRSSKRVKRKHIEELLQCYPRRRFVLVGDSGESDPALYAELASRFGRQIEKVYIRDMGNGGRWRAVLEKLPRDAWHVFADPREL